MKCRARCKPSRRRLALAAARPTEFNGPPQETLTLSVEIDAADQLEKPNDNASVVENGLHPVIAAIERLVYPSYPLVVANEALALAGSAFILSETAPLTLLVWGRRRVLPVRVQSLAFKEEAFDRRLDPNSRQGRPVTPSSHLS